MTLILLTVDTVAEASHFPVSATITLIAGFLLAAIVGSVAWFKSKRPIGWQQEKPTGQASKPDAGYDRGIVPAETKARQQREGQVFKQVPQPEDQSAGGYTTDREGLINNYAIEPEMYVEEPGDLKAEQEALAEERAKQLEEINQSGGKGQGVI